MRSRVFLVAIVIAGALLAWVVLRGVDPGGAPPAGGGEAGVAPEVERPAPPEEAPVPADPPVRVSGLVLAAEDGAPIAGATVRASPWRGDFATTTDARGEWKLDLPPDRYELQAGRLERDGVARTGHRVTASAEGFLARASSWFELPPGAGARRAPTVRLRRVAARIGGRVVDAAGKPLADLPVRVVRPGPFARDCDVWRTTGPDGRFEAVPVEAGDVTVRARETVRRVRVDPGRRPREIDVLLVVGPQRFLEGVVVDDAGAPLAGATVGQAFEDRSFSVTTDEAGRFRWPIPANNAWIEVSKEGYVDPEVSHSDEREWRIVLTRIVPIEGRVVTAAGEPAPGLWLLGLPEMGDKLAAFTGPDGTFRLEAWQPGRLEVLVLRGEVLVGDATFTVVAGEPQIGVEIRLPAPIRIECEVVDAITREPLAGVRVHADPAARGEPDAVTGEDGRFSLLHHPTRTDAWFDQVTLEKEGYDGGPRWLERDEITALRRFSLRPRGTLRVRILDAGGKPVAGARVADGVVTDADGVAVFEMPAGKRRGYRVYGFAGGKVEFEAEPRPGETTDLGDVRLAAPDLDVTIVVTDEEWAPVSDARFETYLGTWWADEAGRIRAPRWSTSRNSVTAPGHEEVRLDCPDDGVDEIPVTLRRSAVLRGRVLDERGRPAVGFDVNTCGPGPDAGATADGLGRFEIEGVAAGVAVPLRIGGDYGLSNIALGVPGGDPVEIRLPGTGLVRVRVGESLPERRVEVPFRAWLLDRRDVRSGGPILCGSWYLGPRPVAWEGGILVYRVPAGRLSVRCRHSGVERAYGPLDLAPGGEVEIVYDSPDPGRARIVVLGADGKPCRFAYVSDALGGEPIAVTDDDGRVEFGFGLEPEPAGVHRFRIEDGAHADLLTGGIDIDPEREVVLSMERGGGVRGEVRRRDGSVAAGARVAVVSEVGPYERVVLAGGDGRFSMPDRLRTGRRILEVRVGAAPPFRREVTIETGKVAQVAIVLPY